MYSVIIVDDEALSRYALHIMLSKNLPDLNVIAECEDGASAVQSALSLKPDIIIIDIKMPGMNGLDASHTILEALPNITILILTAYDRFEYAREALKIGIRGYLLKPLIEKEVVETLQDTMKELAEKRTLQHKSLGEKELASVAVPVIQKNLIASYINGTAASSTLEEYSIVLPGITSAGFFILFPLTTSAGNNSAESNNTGLDEHKLIFDSVNQMLNFHKHVIVGEITFQALPLFYHVSPTDSYWRDTARLLARKIIMLLNERFKLNTGAAFGEIYHSPLLFKKSYQEALETLPRLVPGTIAEYSSQTIVSAAAYPYALEEDLLNALRIRALEKARPISRQILDEIFALTNSLQISKEYTIQLLTAIKNLLYQLGLGQTHIDVFPFLCQVQSSASSQQLKEYAQYALDTFFEFVQTETMDKNYALTKKINHYLEQEPVQRISLEGLSSHLNLTPQYVSRIFKEEFNMNFTDYVTHKKIYLSKPLLEKGTLSVQEVSIRVGYSDQNYFCRIFKKITGLTPKEYQKYAKTL